MLFWHTLYTLIGYNTKAEYCSGTVGDSLAEHNGYQFSTNDKGQYTKCVADYKGGFCYTNCHAINNNNNTNNNNINRKYLKGNHTLYVDSVYWYAFNYYSLKYTEMKFRPW